MNSLYPPVLCHTEMFGINDEKGLFLSLDHINDTISLNFCVKGHMMTLLRATEKISSGFHQEAEISRYLDMNVF